MNVLSRFRRDHDVFRTQLAALEAALDRGTKTWRLWRDISFSLSRHLRAHVRYEDGTVASCAWRLGTIDANTLERFSIDHGQEWRFLQCANGYLAQVLYVPDAHVRAVLAEFIAAFRLGMDQQEAQLFPLINRVFGAQERFEDPQVPPRVLVETMTGNQVIRLYPETRAVFERLFINVTYEGSRGLDELAWNCGIEGRALLTLLETEIARRQAPSISHGAEASHGVLGAFQGFVRGRARAPSL